MKLQRDESSVLNEATINQQPAWKNVPHTHVPALAMYLIHSAKLQGYLAHKITQLPRISTGPLAKGYCRVLQERGFSSAGCPCTPSNGPAKAAGVLETKDSLQDYLAQNLTVQRLGCMRAYKVRP